MKRRLAAAAVAVAMLCGPDVGAGFSRPTQQQNDTPVRILIDQPARAVEYQLGRLTNEELARIERKPDDPRYRLVYVALLTRNGLARELREEAVATLSRMDSSSRTRVLLDALEKLPFDDDATADALAGMVMAQPAQTLRAEKEALGQVIAGTSASPALRAAHGALMAIGEWPMEAWRNAEPRPDQLVELLKSVPLAPLSDNLNLLRQRLAASIASLLSGSTATAEVRTAALRALVRVPERWWPAAEIESFARLMVQLAGSAPADQRADSPAVEAMQLGERLAALLPAAAAAGIRQQLRALGVRVVTVEAVPEQMRFSLNWFVVEAGKPVQVVLVNPDNMPHNLVLGKPGSLETVGTAAMTMSMPADPAVKPYVPSGPLVVAATGLVNTGGSERLNFTAPAAVGEYPYACTFPGHWARMYGVMLVVENLEAWEAAQTTPTDPMTKRPFASRVAP